MAVTQGIWLLAACGITIAGCLIGIGSLGDLRTQLVPFILLFLVAFGAYVGAIWLVLAQPALAAGRRLWLVLGLALAYRLILLPSAPTLSDDVYRYVWEGRVLVAGFSPYRHAPSDPALLSLRDDAFWRQVNNPDVPSPYPPLAQIAGVVAQALTPDSPLGAKLVATAADAVVIAATVALVAAAGAPAGAALVYAWHPLPVIAFSYSGHNDALMMAPLVLALALAARGRRWLPALLVAGAVLVKVTPLLLLPLLPRRLGWAPTLMGGAAVVIAWVPLLVLGGGATGSIVTYLGQWKDNDSVHAVLHAALGPPGAKGVCLALLAAGLAALVAHPRLRDRPLWWRTYVALALAILLASTVHSWYLTWLLPLLAVQLTASRRPPYLVPLHATAWLLFSGLVALPYLTYDTHEWQLWISFAQYVPLFALLALDLLSHLPGLAAQGRRPTVRALSSTP